MRRGKLFGVSVGPGDPELLTLKAVRVIREADVVAVPKTGGARQMALNIAKEYVAGKPLVDCATPMVRDHAATQAAYRDITETLCTFLEEGKDVAYLTLGDATVYSTFLYVQELVKERGFEVEVIPGVPSFCAAAARLGIALCEGSGRLMVLPASDGALEEALDVPATKVLMKAGRALGDLRDTLAERGELDNASMVANCGLPDERVYPRFAEADMSEGYFSVVILRDAEPSCGSDDAGV